MGVPVEATDGRAGKVERLIFDPSSHAITGIVVVQGWLLPNDVVVPIDRVESAGEDSLRVDATVDQVRQMPTFCFAQYTEPPEAWIPPVDMAASMYLFPASPYAVGAFELPAAVETQPLDHQTESGLPPGTIDIGADSEVFCLDGRGGSIDRALTDGPSDEITHLVVRHGAILHHDMVVPIGCVLKTDADGVHLNISRAELETMPRFKVEG